MSLRQKTRGFLLLFYAFSCPVMGQDPLPNESSLRTGGAWFRNFDNQTIALKGSIFLFEQYVPGTIFMLRKEIVSTDKINYDAYHDELMAIHNDREVVVTTGMVRRFVFSVDGDSMRFCKLVDEKGKLGYFQEVFKPGKVGCYKKIFKMLLKPDRQVTFEGSRDYELITRQKLLILESGKPMREFKNTKTFLQAFPEDKDQLRKFIEVEKIDFKNDASLKRLFLYLNQIKAD